MKVESGRRLSSNLAEINITPLVDVMLVLLIIFMVTAPMMQSGITVKLPSAETRPTRRRAVFRSPWPRTGTCTSNDQIINLYLLESRLKNYFYGKEKKVVFLKSDKNVSYGYIVEVMDIIKRAGVETVGLIVEQKTGR